MNQVGAEYDAQKIYMFNLFYCEGDDKTKLSILYDLIVGMSGPKPTKPNDEGLI